MLSVVIPTLRNGKDLVNAIVSAKEADQIIVVNDGGYYDIDPKLRGPDFKHLTILDNTKNRGVTYSRNRGYLNATEGPIIFLDADDALLPSAISIVKKKIQRNPQYGIFLFQSLLEDKKFEKNVIVDRHDPETLITNANKGEKTIVINKKKNFRKLPFVSKFRGHELAGLYRFSTVNSIKILWAPEKIRLYTKNSNGLSAKRFSRDRALLIMDGHLTTAAIAKTRGKCRYTLLYVLKATKYWLIAKMNTKSKD